MYNKWTVYLVILFCVYFVEKNLYELILLLKYYKVATFNFQTSINTKLKDFINYNYQKLRMKKLCFI